MPEKRTDLPEHIEATVAAITDLHAEHYRNAGRMQRMVSLTTSFLARPRTLGLLTFLIVGWIVLNLGLLVSGAHVLDEPPFPYLADAASILALYLTTIILITQRHDDDLAPALRRTEAPIPPWPVPLPYIIAFNLAVLPQKVAPLAEALAVDVAGLTREARIEACAASIRSLYAVIGFLERFTPERFPRQRVRKMAERAVPGLYPGFAAQDFDPASARDDTMIACPSARKMTVSQADAMLRRCLA